MPDEITAFWRDGVVCLRGILDPAVANALAEPVEEALVDPSTTVDMTAMGEALGRAGTTVLVDQQVAAAGTRRGQFRSGVDHWRNHPAFADFACRSALPAVVAQVLQSDHVWLYEDSVLVKEPGTQEPTAFHQDLSYFHVDGTQVCTCWVPLDPNDQHSGAVTYVIGSHRWPDVYRPNLFVTDAPIPDTEGEPVPDLGGIDGDHDLVSFATGPGDVVIHHARTLHGAPGNASATTRRRAVSVRYCGDDARYRIRRGAPRKPHHHRVHDGDPLGGPDCPLVWAADGTPLDPVPASRPGGSS